MRGTRYQSHTMGNSATRMSFCGRVHAIQGIVELLLNYSASPEAQDARGRTPAQILDQILKPPTHTDMVFDSSMLVFPGLMLSTFPTVRCSEHLNAFSGAGMSDFSGAVIGRLNKNEIGPF